MTFASESQDFRRGLQIGIIYQKMLTRKPTIGAIVNVANKDVLEGLAAARGYEVKQFTADDRDPDNATVVLERK